MRLGLIFASFLFCFLFCSANSVVETTGEATYYGDKSESRKVCETKALEMARIAAISNAFGMQISQDIVTSSFHNSYNSSETYVALSSSETKGEWISDINPPSFSYAFTNDNNMSVTCKVRIRARKKSDSEIQFEVKTLRGVPDLQYATTEFNANDMMYLYVRPVQSGYLQVYYMDEEGNLICLLPYVTAPKNKIHLHGGEEYIFFCKDIRYEGFGIPKQYQLDTNQGIEFNKIIAVYSPVELPKAERTSHKTRSSKSISYEDFSNWRVQQTTSNPELGIKIINISIKNPDFQN